MQRNFCWIAVKLSVQSHCITRLGKPYSEDFVLICSAANFIGFCRVVSWNVEPYIIILGNCPEVVMDLSVFSVRESNFVPL